ncbi:MAG: sulfur oxidation c-type cytochrome SoxA [Gammaproteobacteria bacterium]|nr:MAG: sulfur oxidation c-type cytochrome SoxA [Gammaproteobacteria bacterium]
MKKIIIALIATGVLCGLPMAGQASPYTDMRKFQDFYKKKFPTVKFQDFRHGYYTLPGKYAADKRKQWKLIMEFPPYDVALDQGKAFFEKNKLGTCFKNGGKGMAVSYPKVKNGKITTLENAINTCLKSKGLEPFKGKNMKKGKGVAVTAYLKSLSRGWPINVRINPKDKASVAAYNEGKRVYWAKRGQLNFSCANCHVGNAGKMIRGNLLSAGLGHGVGFPAYRSKWGGMGSIHRRFMGCNKQVRAKPLKAQSRTYKALELYEAYNNRGLKLVAPAQRF